ncbi:hypothetical protein B0H10DRAFT_2048984 [Mycena sp. CBHHK59/15]|nr:hypothetical protein B0H10DRAFT_2048984 [Mycena sp. CBHHK59/15]
MLTLRSAPLISRDPGAPLLVGAPVNHSPDLSYTDEGSSAVDPAPVLRIGAGHRIRTPAATAPAFVPPLHADLAEDHGLYGFFRRKADPALRGDERFETFADPTIESLVSWRSWLASELRRKSFKDLHTLWYVLVRERNLLATQREEMRRMGVLNERVSNRADSARVRRFFPLLLIPSQFNLSPQCRKSMARIKAVMNERRLAYEGAVVLAEKEREAAADAAVLEYKVKMETAELQAQRVQQRKARLQSKRAKKEEEPAAAPSEPEKKARWTKVQKRANEQHKLRLQAARRRVQTA